MGNVKIRLCGVTTVTNAQGERVEKLGGVKPRQVLELLALSAGTPVSKHRIAEQIWDGAPPPSYLGTLESYVCLLRRSLGAGRGRNSVLQTTTTGYLLRTDGVSVDVVEARALLARARTSPEDRIRLVAQALDMLAGDLLVSEPYAAWAQGQRDCFTRELVTACTEAAADAHATGDTADAIRFARRAVEMDSLAEQAWQHLIRALADQGRLGEALKAYAELREVMLEELGAEPSVASRGLYVEILQGTRGTRDARGDRAELSTLVRLLRQALEAMPGVKLPAGDEGLSQIAVRVLAAA